MPMKILFVFHFCSPEINSIAGGPLYLGSQGHDVLVVSSQHWHTLKGDVHAPHTEHIEGCEFFRPYPESLNMIRNYRSHWTEVRDKVEEFKPDVVVGFGEFTHTLSMKIQKHLNIPLVLFVEYLDLTKVVLPIKGRSLLLKTAPLLCKIFAAFYQRSQARHCSAIMFSYYGDRHRIPELKKYCPIVRYVPWCCEVNREEVPFQRNPKTGIYIGSLEKFKNTAELVEAIPLILNNTDTERFTVVGPGYYGPKIKALAKKFGSRLKYIESLPRKEALHLIRSAGYGYTPVNDCGLGFIGDCWGNGTPLIATHKLDGFFQAGIDTLFVDGYKKLPRAINELIASHDLQQHFSQNGKLRFDNYLTAKAVGEKYLEIIKQVITG